MTDNEILASHMESMFNQVRFTAPPKINDECVIHAPHLVEGKDWLTVAEFTEAMKRNMPPTTAVDPKETP